MLDFKNLITNLVELTIFSFAILRYFLYHKYVKNTDWRELENK